ncbi:hypothetical protein ACTFIZ_008748 [Dictyostelium cf. discoideum]
MHKDFHITKDLAEESNVEPFRRIETFSNFVNRFNNNPTISKELEKWGINLKKMFRLVFIVKQSEFERGESKKNLDLFIKESQLPNPVVHPVLSRNFCDIRSNIYTDILDEYTNKLLTQCIFSRIFDKGRSVAIKLKQHVIDKLG